MSKDGNAMNILLVSGYPESASFGGQSDTPREAGGLMSWAASKAVGLRV